MSNLNSSHVINMNDGRGNYSQLPQKGKSESCKVGQCVPTYASNRCHKCNQECAWNQNRCPNCKNFRLRKCRRCHKRCKPKCDLCIPVFTSTQCGGCGNECSTAHLHCQNRTKCSRTGRMRKCNTLKPKKCGKCGDPCADYRRTFQPWLFQKKNANLGYWRLYVQGGIPGMLVGWKLPVLIFINIIWWVLNWYFDWKLTDLSIFSPTYDSSRPALPGLFCALLGAMTSILFASSISFAYGVYRSNFRLYRDGAGKYSHLSVLLIGSINWCKVYNDIIPCHQQYVGCRSGNPCVDAKRTTVGVIIRNLINWTTYGPYLNKHLLRAAGKGNNVELHAKPGKHEGASVAPDLKDRIISEERELDPELDATGNDKFNWVHQQMVEDQTWLAKNGYINGRNNKTPEFDQRITNIRNNMGDLQNAQNTPTPILIAQITTFGFLTLHTTLIPVLAATYTWWGMIGFYILTSVALGLTDGMARIQAVFEDPEDNPTIGNINIGKESHTLAKEIHDQWMKVLHDNGLCIDNIHDKYGRVSRSDKPMYYGDKILTREQQKTLDNQTSLINME